MTTRPALFGLRLKDKTRTVKVTAKLGGKQRFVVEDSNAGRTTKREHDSARGAVADAARTWRSRLN